MTVRFSSVIKKKNRLIGNKQIFLFILDSINLNHCLCANARFDVSFFEKNISQNPCPRENKSTRNSLGLNLRELFRGRHSRKLIHAKINPHKGIYI